MILMVASKRDIASRNISEQLLKHYNFGKLSGSFHQNPVYMKRLQNDEVRMIYTNEDLIETQFITDFFTPQLVIFLSRHSSASRIPTLSVHTPGNLGKAKYGGVPRRVSISPGNAMKNALMALVRMRDKMGLEYEVSYEATHHGPSLDVPAMFVEVGSSLQQWRDRRAAASVARAAMAAASKEANYPVALGIGGPHYNEKFTRIALSKDTAFGHMIPKYAVPWLDLELVRHCIERTLEKVESLVLDWKGIRSIHKDKLMTVLAEIGIPVERV